MQPTDLIDQANLRDDVPDCAPGDTLKVHVRVVEGNRERVQVFEGAVIGRQGSGVRETFKVRKLSFGVGVERTFPVHSPSIAKIEVVTRGKVRRAKLYYLRDLRGKKARIKERRKEYGELVIEEIDEIDDAAADIEEAATEEAEAPETPADESLDEGDAEETPEGDDPVED